MASQFRPPGVCAEPVAAGLALPEAAECGRQLAEDAGLTGAAARLVDVGSAPSSWSGCPSDGGAQVTMRQAVGVNAALSISGKRSSGGQPQSPLTFMAATLPPSRVPYRYDQLPVIMPP